MSRWSRLTRAVAARVDALVSQVENHDAVAESAVRCVRERLARARSALVQAEHDRAQLEADATREEAQAATARQHARSHPDEGVALEWLRRSRRSARRASELRAEARTFREAAADLGSEVARLEDDARTLARTRHLLRAREERAEAVRAVVGSVDRAEPGLRGTIERWESRIHSAEAASDAALRLSRIEEELSFDESGLAAELAELRRNAP